MDRQATGKCLLAVVYVLSAIPPALDGQTTAGAVNGTVRDPTGAVVPEPRSISGTRPPAPRSAPPRTTAATSLSSTSSQAATRSARRRQGFKKAIQTLFSVGVNETVTLNVSLTVGDIGQTVEVTAEAALLQQSTSELGTVIAEEAVKELPLNGRNFTQLLTLTPGATPVNTAQGNGGGTGFNAPLALPGSTFVIPSINGQWNRSNMFLLDGIVNEFFFGSSYAILPIIDAVQEFKVQSHNDKAEYGGVLGGVINVVSKSGGNRRPRFRVGVPAQRLLRCAQSVCRRGPLADRRHSARTCSARTIGGPVWIPKVYKGRDRTWFHFAYEGWRYSRAQQQLL